MVYISMVATGPALQYAVVSVSWLRNDPKDDG